MATCVRGKCIRVREDITCRRSWEQEEDQDASFEARFRMLAGKRPHGGQEYIDRQNIINFHFGIEEAQSIQSKK